MDPRVDSKMKILDAIIPMLHTDSEIRVVQHNSLVE